MSALEIENCFDRILSRIEESPFKGDLRRYKKALLDEQKFLNESYHPAFFAKGHPLRAAKALKELLDEHYKMTLRRANCYTEKLSYFQSEATNSKFYPRTRILAQILAGALMTFALASLLGFLLGFPFPAILFVAAAIAVVALFPVYSTLIAVFARDNLQPIFQSEKSGSYLFEQFDPDERPVNDSLPRGAEMVSL